jgi:phosphoribosylformylglycinamidine cyclo-ligase
MASSGLHSNGYSLARNVLLGEGRLGLDAHVTDLGRTVGEEMLEPTRIYARDVLDLIEAVEVHAVSHVTGGGLAANIARVLPPELAADIARSSWSPMPIFDLISREGSVPRAELERTFNMGIGMVAVLPPAAVDPAIALLRGRGIAAWACGEVRARRDGEEGDAAAKGVDGGAVRLVGEHPAR